MKSRAIYSLGDPGSFDISDKTNPLYYIARFSHEMSKNFHNLNVDGFLFKQPENSDFDNFETAYDTFGNDMSTWYENAVAASMLGNDPPALPAIPDITTLLPWIAANPFLLLLSKIAIRLFLMWLRRRLFPDTQAGEVAQILKTALFKDATTPYLAALFDDFDDTKLAQVLRILQLNISDIEASVESMSFGIGDIYECFYVEEEEPPYWNTLAGIIRKGLLKSSDSSEFSLLELAVQNPIKIWLTRSDLIDDMFISQL